MKIVLRGNPRTKKNSQRIVMMAGHPAIMPSAAYKQYERDCLMQITGDARRALDEPVQVTCLYYMETRRRVDLTNLLEATDDILVKAGVLKDDHSGIIVSHDGSRVLYDKADPRVEIRIEREGIY